MWGHEQGRQSRDRALEELVRQESRPGPFGDPPSRRPSFGGASALAFVAVLVLFVLVGDCSGDSAEAASSATSTASAATTVT